jgi:hypothetical protein
MIDATKLFSTAVGEALVEQNIDKNIERAAKNGLNITDTILCEFTSDTVIYENVDNVNSQRIVSVIFKPFLAARSMFLSIFCSTSASPTAVENNLVASIIKIFYLNF